MDLFFVEIRVRDARRSLRWYTETLGLPLLMDDPSGGFALLKAGTGRVALKQDTDFASSREAVGLTFLVDDLGVERERLSALGVDVSEPAENAEEHYREVRLRDPDGTPLRLFAWTKSQRG